MVKVLSTIPYEENDKEEGYYSECIYVFQYESDEESDDFQILSHDEQLQLCGFKEEKTTSKTELVHRYFIDAGDVYVVVRECVYGL